MKEKQLTWDEAMELAKTASVWHAQPQPLGSTGGTSIIESIDEPALEEVMPTAPAGHTGLPVTPATKEVMPPEAAVHQPEPGLPVTPAGPTPAEAEYIQKVSSPGRHISLGRRGVELRTAEDLWTFAVKVSRSGVAPKGLERPESIFVALELGLELGLPPMAALQNIAVINGRPGIFGDAALALVRASGLCKSYDEYFEVGGERVEEPTDTADTTRAVSVSWRVEADKPVVRSFSIADAKRAKLWGKDGPWTFYWGRMLRFRARGFNLRDNFSDVLKGFKTVEELMDYDPVVPDPDPRSGTPTEQLKAKLQAKA
jgi:hypothetical protein